MKTILVCFFLCFAIDKQGYNLITINLHYYFFIVYSQYHFRLFNIK